MATQPVEYVPPSSPTNLKTANMTSTGILNNIFNLVLKMTTSLQRVASAQADRLNVYTQWQTAYTNVMSKIHTFIQGNNDTLNSSSDQNVIRARQDLNQINANYTQTLQNRQSVISDSAKSLQSNVSQSNDAVNQQSNLATSILQELGTLLSAIYK